jgi:iron(III) transport system permease protein
MASLEREFMASASVRPSYRRGLPRWGHGVLPATICTVAVVLVVLPMAWLLVGPSIESGRVNVDFLTAVFGQRRLVRALENTVTASLWTAACSTVLGVVLAFLTVRTDLPLRRSVSVLVVGSFVTSSYLLAFAYVVLLGPNAGVINQFLVELLALDDAPFDIYSFGGYVFVATLEAVPIVFLTVSAALQTLDGSFENAGRILGAGRLRVALTITLPLVAPAIGAGGLLAFISTLSLYGAPAILGVRVVPTEIQALLGHPARFDLAAGMSLYLVVLALAGLVAYQRLLARAGRFVVVTGKWGAAEPIRLGWLRWVALGACIAYLVVALVLPYIVLGYAAISHAVGATPSLANLTLANFRFILTDELTLRGFRNSLVLSFGAALAAVALAAVIGFLAVRRRELKIVALVDAIVMLPFGIPSVVIALGLILAFIRPPLVLYGTLWIIGLAYLIKFMPIAVRSLAALFEQIDPALEEASRVCGASPTTTFLRVSLPLVRPGLIGAGCLVFIPCFRELGASIILASPYNETAAFAMITAWGAVSFEVTCAIGVAMLVVAVAIQLAFVRARRIAFGS